MDSKGIIIDISVVIPTYNRYDFLKKAVRSLLSQTYLPKEIIVVDDGSEDETSKIQKDFPQIKYIYQKNSGVSSARNLGIKNSISDWIAFLDSDDQWHTDKLAKQVEFHKNNPEILMSYTDELWIKDGKEVNIPKKFQKQGGDIFEKSLGFCNIAPSAVVIHKSIFENIGVFDESLEVCEDYDLWLRIAISNSIGLIDEKLIVKYAGHEDQLSFKHWGMDRFRIIALEKLLMLEDINAFSVKRKLIINELIKKYTLLLKGALKYDRIPDIKKYEKRLKELEHEPH